MDKSDEIVIHISKNMKITVEELKNGVVSFKEVEPNTFVECIKSSLKQGMICSGVLPDNCVSYSSSEDGNRYVTIVVDEQKSDITYEKTLYEGFPLPRLIFGFYIDKSGRIYSVNLGVIAKGKVTPETKMYHYPFSNVGGFNLCTGGNSFPKITSLHQLCGIPNYILSMPNNNDRYEASHNKLRLEFRALLEHLKDKTSDYYYKNILIESGKKVKDFINWRSI